MRGIDVTYYYGACIYPEVWDRETFITDIEHMKSLNMNFARIGEFIWGLLEPEEGKYDFQVLTDALDLLHQKDMHVMVCIPTPTPPRWMTYQHEERLTKNQAGQTLIHGSRQHICTNNLFFREKAHLLAEKIAEITVKYPNVMGIQLDNEFKAHTDLCVCDNCKAQWPLWLEEKYGTIDQLNDAWGTNVWSERYNAFEEVVVPEATPFLHNTSLLNAYRTFTEDKINTFVAEQVQAIRTHTQIPITHNSALGFNLNNYDLFSHLDIASFDTYASAENYAAYTLNLDLWRNMKDNGEFMLLETSTAHAGHIESYGKPHPEGYLQTELFLNFAAGSKAFNFWHFRKHTHGCEQPHTSVVTSWGEPDIGYNDVVKSGTIFADVVPQLEATTLAKPKLALIYSDRGRRYILNEPSRKYQYRSLLTDFYASLLNKGYTVDVIPEQKDLTSYETIFIPYLHFVSEDLLARIQQFVEKGGTCIIGPMTGDRTAEHAWPKNNGLMELGEWLGVKNFNQFETKGMELVGTMYGRSERISGYSSFMEPSEDSVILATGENGIIQNRTYGFEKNFGKGKVIYLGALPENLESSLQWELFVKKNLPLNEVHLGLNMEVGIVKYIRETANGMIQVWLANVTESKKKYELLKSHTTIWTNGQNTSQGQLNPYECRIIQIK